MKLYYIPGACSLAVHIALRKAGSAPELVRYDPTTGNTEDGQPLREVNPKGYVPVLIDDTGEMLTEVVATLIELDARYPEAGLLPREGNERTRAIEWLAYASAELHRHFVIPLFMDTPQTDDIRQARDKVEARLALVADSLPGAQAYFLGDRFTAVDSYLLVLLLWTGPAKVDLGRWPQLGAYRDRLLQDPAIAAAMKAEGLT